MKYILLILTSCFILNAQESNQDSFYDITYKTTYYLKSTSTKPRIEQAKLYVKDEIKLFQADKKRVLDSLIFENVATDEDRSTYFTRNGYVIEINDNYIKYYDEIGNYAYFYEEHLSHNWKLGVQTKEINGIMCRDAIVDYGGRTWTAWYSPSLPLNAGPYKFQGLPGLIVKISDATGVYDFEIVSIVKNPSIRLSKYPVFNSTLEIVETNRVDFNNLKSKWEELSINEAMAIMNGGSKEELVFTNNGENNLDMSSLSNRRVTNLNYIEIDNKK